MHSVYVTSIIIGPLGGMAVMTRIYYVKVED